MDFLVAVKCGEHEDAGSGGFFADFEGGFDAGFDGHAEVHEDEVGVVLGKKVNGLLAVGGLGDDGDVRLGVDEGDEAHADERVVGDEDADFVFVFHVDSNQAPLNSVAAAHWTSGESSVGISTRTIVPEPGVLVMVSLPQRRWARSDMPRRPKWPSRGPA